MGKIALIPVNSQGHINTILPLALALRERGHRVTMVIHEDSEQKIADVGLESRTIGTEQFPKGFMENTVTKVGKLSGAALFKSIVQLAESTCKIHIKELPKVFDELAPDLVIVDECNSGVHSVCQSKKISTATLCSALTMLPDPAIPPQFTHRGPSTTLLERWQNQLQYFIQYQLLFGSVTTIINEYRKKASLRPISATWEEASPLLWLTQEPEQFSFPRSRPVQNLHYMGPIYDARREVTVPFPWKKLDGRPLVYASMGTVQNRLVAIFKTIAAACSTLDVQLVISLGGGFTDPKVVGILPGDPIVVPYAPQLELLDRAAAFITHAGMNSTVECLGHGVPMVALPVGNDQPGIAARIQHCGAGISLQTSAPKEEDLRNALKQVLSEPHFREDAKRMASCIDPRAARGKACDLIENAMQSLNH